MSDESLFWPLEDGDLLLEILAESHCVPLRAACARDTEIWQIYPFNYVGDDFDLQFQRMLAGGTQRRCYAILKSGEVVGMTAWLAGLVNRDRQLLYRAAPAGNWVQWPAQAAYA